MEGIFRYSERQLRKTLGMYRKLGAIQDKLPACGSFLLDSWQVQEVTEQLAEFLVKFRLGKSAFRAGVDADGGQSPCLQKRLLSNTGKEGFANVRPKSCV